MTGLSLILRAQFKVSSVQKSLRNSVLGRADGDKATSLGKPRAMTNDKYLHIYLADHHAGSVAGIELARRCASSNKNNDIGQFLVTTLIPAIEEDRASLGRIMQRVGASENRLKNLMFWTGEKLGRLKLNGELTSYSSLSRLVELEGLTSGVAGKLALWQSLRETHDPRLDPIDLTKLIARAEEQLKGLELQRRKAAVMALRSEV